MGYQFHMRRLSRSISCRHLLYAIIGYWMGMLFHTALVHIFAKPCTHSISPTFFKNGAAKLGPRHSSVHPSPSNIYVGMMSAGKFITNRVQRSLDTWLQKGDWKVEVFAEADPSLLTVPIGLDFKIVTLPTVDDTAYPPQKKCFLMLRHMFDEHIENYEWFMRVDDDVYMDYPRLSHLLGTINSSLPIFLGTPGFGMDPDDGIEIGMYYLMGGPGMIFSRGLMRLLRSHLSYCIRHMFSPHEDIEIGRCVWKNVKTAIIPIAWETIDFFYQQYEKTTGDVVNIVIEDLTRKRTAKTFAYHSVKSEVLLYQLHRQVLQRQIEALINKTSSYQQEMNRMMALLRLKEATDLSFKLPLSDLPLILGSDGEIANYERKSESHQWPETSPWIGSAPVLPRYLSQVIWTNFDKYYRHQTDVLVPMRGHSDRERTALLRHLSKLNEQFLVNFCPDFPKDHNFHNGYLQETRFNGLMLTATYRAYDKGGARYCTISAQVSYGLTLFHEQISSILLDKKLKSLRRNSPANEICSLSDGTLLDGKLNGLTSFNELCPLNRPADRVVLIVPLQGRYKALQNFMERYEKDFLRPIRQKNGLFSDASKRKVLLVIVLLGQNDNNDQGLNDAASNLLKNYMQTHGTDLLRFHFADNENRDFSRGAGMQLGSLVANPNDILFFMDIDMIVTPSLVSQCRAMTTQRQMAWYPVPFSQYDPDKLCLDGGLARNADEDTFLDFANPAGEGYSNVKEQIKQTPLKLSKNRGFWRDFGFGIACMYKSDFVRAGGFDLTIEGWGEEDIRMYLSLLKAGLNVFRSKQSDLIHIYHPKHCDESLVGEQAQSCRRTKASHYADLSCLARTYFAKMKNLN